MRVVVLVLAIIGGVLGVMFAFMAMFVGAIGEELTGDSTVIWLGLSALGAAILGIVSGATSFGSRRKKLSALGLIVAAIWHVVSISFFGIPALVFFLLAGILGFFVKAPQAEGRRAEGDLG